MYFFVPYSIITIIIIQLSVMNFEYLDPQGAGEGEGDSVTLNRGGGGRADPVTLDSR